MSIVPQLIINSLITGSVYALMAMGFNLTYDTAKFPNIAHGSSAVVGGYTVFYLANQHGLNLYASIVLGVLAAGIFGWLCDRVIYAKLRKRKATSAVLLIASLGIFTMVEAGSAVLFSSQFQTLASLIPNQKIFLWHNLAFTEIQLLTFIASIAVLLLAVCGLKFTQFGKALRAVSDDAEVAKIVGINTEKIIGSTFFIGGAIAGLAGIMVGLDTGIQPTMGLFLLLSGFGATIIGGVGNVYGSFLGAVIIGFLENFGVWTIAAEWKATIAFVVIILFLIFRPQGLLKK